jgi:hypothetical protein
MFAIDNVNSFDHPLVEEIVERISQQAPDYYRAVHKSAETAHKGCSFARDAVDFCKRLIRAKDSVGALKEGLDNIKEVAKNAHEDSEEMYQQFKDIRVELFKVRFLLNHLWYLPQAPVSLDSERHSVQCSW